MAGGGPLLPGQAAVVRGDAGEVSRGAFKTDLEERAGGAQRGEERSWEAEGTTWRIDTKGKGKSRELCSGWSMGRLE